MSEYRYNLITDQWVIIADDRGRRPTDFQPTEEPKNSDFDDPRRAPSVQAAKP